MTFPTPTVHLNGTSANSLLNDTLTALGLLRSAHKAMCDAGPHARDYYVQPDPNAFEHAQDAHRDRLAAVERVMTELEAIGLAVVNQSSR